MDILYAKSALQRKKKFQIVTKVVNDDAQKYVIKRAAFAESIPHIYRTYDNTELAKKLYGSKTTVSEMKNDAIIMPFFDGISLSDKLQECLRKENVKDEITPLLQLWKSIIIGNDSNKCGFVLTDEFRETFGETKELIGNEAVAISNVDCTGDNILFLSDDSIKILDYEWIFNYPVPVEFIFYRVLKKFYENNRSLIDWYALLSYAQLSSEKVDIYERLLKGFSEYTGYDSKRDINYCKLGNQFKEAKIDLTSNRFEYFYEFPEMLLPEKSRLIVYGAGRVGTEYYNYLSNSDAYTIIAWVDKRASLYHRHGMKIVDVDEIKNLDYDYVLISVMKKAIADEIKGELMEAGVSEGSIVWKQPERLV